MRFCGGAFAKVLYICRKPKKTQPEMVAEIFRCFDLAYQEDASYANRFLACSRPVPPTVIDEARKINFDDLYRRVSQKLVDMLDRSKDELAVLALHDILEKDIAIGDDIVIDCISRATKRDILAKKEFCFEEFLASMLFYMVDSVDNTEGERYASSITKEYAGNFASQKGRITFVKRGGDYSASIPAGLTQTEKEIARINAIFERMGDKRPKKIEPPKNIDDSERPYVTALFEAFAEAEELAVLTEKLLIGYPNHRASFLRHRGDYYAAVSIREFTRDLFTNEETDDFDSLKKEVYHGIVDLYEDEYKNGLSRLRKVLTHAGNLITTKCILSRPQADVVGASEKKGVCHVLVCDGLIDGWVRKDA